MTNRSIRTIRTVTQPPSMNPCQEPFKTPRMLTFLNQELEYLTDARILTPTQLSSILALLPAQTPLHAPVSPPLPTTTPTSNLASHLRNTLLSPPAEKKASTPIAEKSDFYSSPQPTPAPLPPPAYSHTPSALASASALYEYMPSDAGDLALLPNDRVTITEFMNADWAKGRNERTAAEGIFPRSYVHILDEKSGKGPMMMGAVPPAGTASGYGNVPLEVSQTGGGGGAVGESKFNQQGKKFGKKMGNAGTSFVFYLFFPPSLFS